MAIEKLIFVYNANSGKINAWLDSAHKIVSPSTYNCRLCDLTYGVFKEKEKWIRFRESELLNSYVQQLQFLHIDEFEKQYRSKWLPKYDFPVILTASNQGLQPFMDARQLNAIESTTELIEAIKMRLN